MHPAERQAASDGRCRILRRLQRSSILPVPHGSRPHIGQRDVSERTTHRHRRTEYVREDLHERVVHDRYDATSAVASDWPEHASHDDATFRQTAPRSVHPRPLCSEGRGEYLPRHGDHSRVVPRFSNTRPCVTNHERVLATGTVPLR